jgi:hypothetical protein
MFTFLTSKNSRHRFVTCLALTNVGFVIPRKSKLEVSYGEILTDAKKCGYRPALHFEIKSVIAGGMTSADKILELYRAMDIARGNSRSINWVQSLAIISGSLVEGKGKNRGEKANVVYFLDKAAVKSPIQHLTVLDETKPLLSSQVVALVRA